MIERAVILAEACALAGSGENKLRAVALARAYNYTSSPWWTYLGGCNDDRTYFVFGSISDGGEKFIAEMENCPGRITVQIDSPGGDTAEALKVGRWLAARGNSVAIVTGNCSSAANIILAGGEQRVAQIESKFMLHAIQLAVCGTAPTLRANAGRLEVWSAEVSAFLSERFNQPLARVQSWLSGSEVYFNPAEAQSLGMVHRITPAAIARPVKPPEAVQTDDWLAMELCRALRKLDVSGEAREQLRAWLTPQ